MRHFQLTSIALLIVILAVVPLAGCVPASEDEDWENKYETLKIEHIILKTDMETVQADIAYLKSASEISKAEYDTLEADYTTLKASSRNIQADYDVIQSSYNALRTDYNKLNIDYDTVKANYNSLKANYDTLVVLYNKLVLTAISAPPEPAPTYPTPTPTPTPIYATWIDEHEATYGELPVVPDWMLPLMPELNPGDRIRQDVIFIKASAQYWALRSPSQKEMILETVSWLGMNPIDYEWSIGR